MLYWVGLYAGGYINRPFVLSHTQKTHFNWQLMHPVTYTYSQHNILIMWQWTIHTLPPVFNISYNAIYNFPWHDQQPWTSLTGGVSTLVLSFMILYAFMKVHMCWYKYDLKLKTFDLNTKYFHTPEFSDDPSSFISESEIISGRDLRRSISKSTSLCLTRTGAATNFQESILRSSVPQVTTWDGFTLTDERRRIVWKFRGMEIFCVEIKSFKL